MDPRAGRPCTPAGDMGGQIQSAIWFKTADADLRPAAAGLMIAPSSLFWGVTEGYVCLACLSRSGSSTILLPSVLTQAISGLFVAQPTCISSAKTVTKAESCRRRLLMRYPQVDAFVVSVTALERLSRRNPTLLLIVSTNRRFGGRGGFGAGHCWPVVRTLCRRQREPEYYHRS
jgi:hypothetical protein